MGFIDESILINIAMSTSTQPATYTQAYALCRHATTMLHTCNGDQTCRHGVEYYMCASVFTECDRLHSYDCVQ